MIESTRLRALSASLALIAGLPASNTAPQEPQIVWSQAGANGRETVYSTADRPGNAPTQVLLQDLRFLDLEITNRTRGRGLDGSISRRVVRDGLALVELPGNGSLFAYERAGGSFFGFLHVDGTGNPRVVDERPASPPNQSPYDDRIGVAFDGLHAAVPFLDGRVLIVRLDGGTYPSSGGAGRFAGLPGTIETTSLCPLDQSLVCGNENDRVFQIPYADGSAPIDRTPLAAGNDRLKSEFACSGDGRAVVFLYGPRDLFGLYRLAETGAAIQLPPPPSKYEEPGYLPETDFGPRLLLDFDGSHLFYVDGILRDEAFTMELSTGQVSHVTGDANFQPYIGVVVLPLAIGDAFVTGIGDPDQFDLYATEARVPQVLNLTTTAGNLTPPFASGALSFGAIGLSGTGELFFEATPTAGGDGAIAKFGPAGLEVMAGSTIAAPVLGSGFGGTGDLLVETRDGPWRFDHQDLSTRLSAPSGIRLTTSVARPIAGGETFRTSLAEVGPNRFVVFELGSTLVTIPVDASARTVAIQPSGSVLIGGSSLLRLESGSVRGVSTSGTAPRLLSGRVSTAL